VNRLLLPTLSLLLLVSCGGNKAAPPSTPPDTPSTPSTPSTGSSSGSTASSGDAGGSSAPSDEDLDEVSATSKAAAAAAKPSTATGTTGGGTLDTLLDKTAKKDGFPKKTASDKDCLREAQFMGKADKDYDALMAKCGAPTGMKEYTKKTTGKLDAKHPRDTYRVKMLGGFCYRFWAIGDKEVGNLDIRVQTPKGALVSIDQSTQAVAVLDPDEPWCKSHDRDFDFVVETQNGKGTYVFGVWARPK
jgi:hypothetical protein